MYRNLAHVWAVQAYPCLGRLAAARDPQDEMRPVRGPMQSLLVQLELHRSPVLTDHVMLTLEKGIVSVDHAMLANWQHEHISCQSTISADHIGRPYRPTISADR